MQGAGAPAGIRAHPTTTLALAQPTRDHRRACTCLSHSPLLNRTAGVIVIAATNFPESLDKALVRPGRFDRHVVRYCGWEG